MSGALWYLSCLHKAHGTCRTSCLLKQQLEASLEAWDISSSTAAHTCVGGTGMVPLEQAHGPVSLTGRDRSCQTMNCPTGLCCLLIWLSWEVETVLLLVLCSIQASTELSLETWGFQVARRGNAIVRPRHDLPDITGFGKRGCVPLQLTH